MKAVPHRASRHSKVTLWVEDDLTRRALEAFWEDPALRAQTAYGWHGVHQHVAMLVPGEPPGLPLGLVDRDFGQDNIQLWMDPKLRGLFKIDAHEFENLLLDFEAIACVSRRHTASEIERVAKEYTARLVPWMACRHTLDDIRGCVQQGQTADPAPPPSPTAPADENAAIEHILKGGYLKALNARLKSVLSDNDIRAKVSHHMSSYQHDLASGQWVRSFSGKEILRHLRTSVDGLDTPVSGLNATERDTDLAVRIATEMRKTCSHDHTLRRLVRALRLRLVP